MKIPVLTFILVIFADIAAAQVYLTRNAKVTFFSETPLENIEATNNTASSLINTTTDSVLVKIKNTAFTFKNALMQDHFNENYMESSKYPISIFRGKISRKPDYSKDGSYHVTATGRMSIHGVERMITIGGILSVKGSELNLFSEFTVKPTDYRINIPKLVFNKIAEEVKVTFNSSYQKK